MQRDFFRSLLSSFFLLKISSHNNLLYSMTLIYIYIYIYIYIERERERERERNMIKKNNE